MSKKIFVASVEDDEIIIKFNKKQWDLIPEALATAIGVFIVIHKDSGCKDYEINNQLKMLISEAWERTGSKPKDIVEEI